MSTHIASGRQLLSKPGPQPLRTPPAFQRSAEIQTLVDKAKSLPDVRWDKIEKVRRALANNEYDTTARLDSLLDRLADAHSNASSHEADD
jgi:3-methyladenine DNA glycosylase AlkC